MQRVNEEQAAAHFDNAEAPNVFTESTSAVNRREEFALLCQKSRHFFESVFRLKVVVFWSIICGYNLTTLSAAGNKMSHIVLSHCKQPSLMGLLSEIRKTVAEIQRTKTE